jgi:hypothetical protein
MAVAITVGDLRNKSKTRTADDLSDRYTGDIPIVVGGIERGVMTVSIVVQDAMTNTQVLGMLDAGFSVTFNGS